MSLFDGGRGAVQHVGGEESNSDQKVLWRPCGTWRRRVRSRRAELGTYSYVVQKIRPKSKFVRRTPKLVSAWKTPSGVFGVVFSTQSRTDSRISTANLLAS